MIEFLKPIEVNEAELGFDAIKGVATGGHFFGEPHTMARYEHAFYRRINLCLVRHRVDLIVRGQFPTSWQASFRCSCRLA
jgi:hypothetical protein